MRTLIFLLTLLFSTLSFADSCVKALKMDTIKIDDKLLTRISFLKIIDEERWKEMKKSQDIDTDFLGFGMSINGDSSYKKLKSEREKVFHKYSYTDDSEHAFSYFSQTLNTNAMNAYLACLRTKTNSFGVHVIPIKITEALVQLQVVLNSPHKAEKVKVSLDSLIPTDEGSKKTAQQILDRLTIGGEQRITFFRDKTTDFSININAFGGFDASGGILIASEPKINTVIPPPRKVIELCNGSTNCGAKVNFPGYDLDAGNWNIAGAFWETNPKVTATQVCRMHGFKYKSHKVYNKPISCGSLYSLIFLKDKTHFYHYRVKICSRKIAKVINNISCYKN